MIALTNYIDSNHQKNEYYKQTCEMFGEIPKTTEYGKGAHVGCFQQMGGDKNGGFEDIKEYESWNIQVDSHPITQYNGLYKKVRNDPLTFKNTSKKDTRNITPISRTNSQPARMASDSNYLYKGIENTWNFDDRLPTSDVQLRWSYFKTEPIQSEDGTHPEADFLQKTFGES